MKAIVGLVLAVVTVLLGVVLVGLAVQSANGTFFMRDAAPMALVILVAGGVGAVAVSYLRRSRT